MSIDSLVGWQGVASVGIGICTGLAEFVWHTTVQKVCMVVAKLEFKPKLDPDDEPPILSFEFLDKQFIPGVVHAPIGEEVFFRGVVQPILTYGISTYFPQLRAATSLGISQASFLSILTTAIGFGTAHYPNYEKGGAFVSTMGSVAGIVYGVIREKFGLIASIAAHMTSNLSTGLFDKYWPEALEFSWERELRLLPPKERELKLLQEAIERVDTADASWDKRELKQLRSKWEEQIQQLRTD